MRRLQPFRSLAVACLAVIIAVAVLSVFDFRDTPFLRRFEWQATPTEVERIVRSGISSAQFVRLVAYDGELVMPPVIINDPIARQRLADLVTVLSGPEHARPSTLVGCKIEVVGHDTLTIEVIGESISIASRWSKSALFKADPSFAREVEKATSFRLLP